MAPQEIWGSGGHQGHPRIQDGGEEGAERGMKKSWGCSHVQPGEFQRKQEGLRVRAHQRRKGREFRHLLQQG